MEEFKEHFELIKTYLPKYLSPEATEKLFSDVKDNFPYSTNPNIIYECLDENTYFQGDGIAEMVFPKINREQQSFDINNFDSIILSNSCDINEEKLLNRQLSPLTQVVFSAIFKVEDYLIELRSRNIAEERIEGFINSLKVNEISNLFYLPEYIVEDQIILQESFIQFDLSTSHPVDYLIDQDLFNNAYTPLGDRLFSFSNYGFYLFLFKLSVHFCRFREGVFRN